MNLKEELQKRVDQGYLKALKNGNLTLYNYLPKAMYDKAWDDYVEMARGLILHDDGSIVARPFLKFFGLNEVEKTRIENLPKDVPELSVKLDGSLIVVFWNTETSKWQSVTRGCWDNKQTQYANNLLPSFQDKLHKGYTYLFELVASWNRIVVTYDKDQLILTGIVQNVDGQEFPYSLVRDYALQNGMPFVDFEVKAFDLAKLKDTSVANLEGYVARYSNGLRVKLKYAQYVTLHKILTGLSVKGIWEMLFHGQELDRKFLPQDFLDWFNRRAREFMLRHDGIESRTLTLFRATKKRLGTDATRKDFAMIFVKHPESNHCYLTCLMKSQYAKAYLSF